MLHVKLEDGVLRLPSGSAIKTGTGSARRKSCEGPRAEIVFGPTSSSGSKKSFKHQRSAGDVTVTVANKTRVAKHSQSAHSVIG
mmetsp:Transcript_17848/g.36594  ORF Transcript_17848/g.36594 Transcript_17848/m.36594 type:complete len:84 (+) Transcript_17848:2-253(+)